MQSRRWLIPALIAGLLLFFVVAFLILGLSAIVFKRRAVEPTSLQAGWVDPVYQIDVEQVSPATALLKLGGKDDITAINSALRGGDVESAYSLVVLSPQLSDEERIGSLLLVGKRYAADGNVNEARKVYRQINLIAVLSPTLSDFARADALLQSSEELIDLELVNEALVTLNQARSIALHSVYLKPAHRKLILDRLISAYSALGVGREAWEELEVALDSGWFDDAPSVEAVRPVLGGLASGEQVDLEVQTVQTKRERQATLLAEYIRDRGGKISQTLVEDLATALLVEDARRQGIYQAGILQASHLADKIALMENRVDWLTLKYSVALQAQGLSLVPAWEQQLGSIQSELAKARQELYALYGGRIVTLPDISQVDRAWLELFRLQLEMGRLGLYPNYPEEQLIAKLKEATENLMADGIDQSLRVDTVSEEERPMFVLVDGEDYGKGLMP